VDKNKKKLPSSLRFASKVKKVGYHLSLPSLQPAAKAAFALQPLRPRRPSQRILRNAAKRDFIFQSSKAMPRLSATLNLLLPRSNALAQKKQNRFWTVQRFFQLIFFKSKF